MPDGCCLHGVLGAFRALGRSRVRMYSACGAAITSSFHACHGRDVAVLLVAGSAVTANAFAFMRSKRSPSVGIGRGVPAQPDGCDRGLSAICCSSAFTAPGEGGEEQFGVVGNDRQSCGRVRFQAVAPSFSRFCLPANGRLDDQPAAHGKIVRSLRQRVGELIQFALTDAQGLECVRGLPAGRCFGNHTVDSRFIVLTSQTAWRSVRRRWRGRFGVRNALRRRF